MPRRYHELLEDPQIKLYAPPTVRNTVTVANLVFAFSNHPTLISIVKILKDSKYNWVKIQVHIRTQQIALLFYILTICFGYIQFGKDVPGMILLRKESPGDKLDFLMTAVQVLILFGIMINIANYCNASLDNIVWLFPKNHDVYEADDITDKNKWAILGYLTVMSFLCFLINFELAPIIDISVSILGPVYIVIVPG